MSAQAARLLSLEEEEITLRRSFPSTFFTPNGKQEEYMALPDRVYGGGASKKTVQVFLWLGANDTGKTRALDEIIAAVAKGKQSEWSDLPFYRDFKRPSRGRVVSTQKALEEALIPEMLKTFASDLAEGYPKKSGHSYYAKWKLKNGTAWDCYTWDMSVTQHAGAFLDWVVFDEPGKKGIFDEVVARLRRGGPVFWGMTPVDETGGLKTELAWVFDEMTRVEEGRNTNWHIVTADAEDNCQQCGIRGRVPHETIMDRFERWKDDPVQLQARFYGKHVRELGRVLKWWDDEKNVFSAADVMFNVHPSWPRFTALDTHPSKPDVWTMGVLNPFHQFWIIAEVVSAGLIREVAQEIRQKLLVWGYPKVSLIDPLAMTPNPIDGNSVFLEYQTHGVVAQVAGAEKQNKNIGIAKTNEMIKGLGEAPMLMVSDACPFAISQAKRWMTDPKTLQPGKTHDDSWENIYRMVLHLPQVPHSQEAIVHRAMENYESSLVV